MTIDVHWLLVVVVVIVFVRRCIRILLVKVLNGVSFIHSFTVRVFAELITATACHFGRFSRFLEHWFQVASVLFYRAWQIKLSSSSELLKGLVHQLRHKIISENLAQMIEANIQLILEKLCIFKVKSDLVNAVVIPIHILLNWLSKSHIFDDICHLDSFKLLWDDCHLLNGETLILFEINLHAWGFDVSGSRHEDFLQSWDTKRHVCTAVTS